MAASEPRFPLPLPKLAIPPSQALSLPSLKLHEHRKVAIVPMTTRTKGGGGGGVITKPPIVRRINADAIFQEIQDSAQSADQLLAEVVKNCYESGRPL